MRDCRLGSTRKQSWHRPCSVVAPMTSSHTHPRNFLSMAFASLALAFAGCATGSQQVREQRPAGIWQVRLPTSQGPRGLYAAGGPSGIAAGDTRPANIDGFLKPEYAKAAA